MPSRIDPTKPQDGVAAVKSELRANLAAAKAEIEHMGFYEGAVKGRDALDAQKARLDALASRLTTLDARLAALEGRA